MPETFHNPFVSMAMRPFDYNINKRPKRSKSKIEMQQKRLLFKADHRFCLSESIPSKYDISCETRGKIFLENKVAKQSRKKRSRRAQEE